MGSRRITTKMTSQISVASKTVLLVGLYIVSCKGFGIPSAKFGFASYYGDHMVLQQIPKIATIWGYASKISDSVTIYLNNIPVGKTTTRIGPFPDIPVWSITLPAMGAGGPHTITVKSSEGEITLKDVWYGDVWLCSGQSNMQFTVSMGLNASQEIADAVNHPNIRVFTVALNGSKTPQYDLLEIDEKWSIPNNESIGGVPWSHFSAVCWLYGKYLATALNNPIGLIATSYGGTCVEAWSSPDALKECPSGNKNDSVVEDDPPNPNSDTVLWNAMARPFVNMTIYGAIWYQGETNSLPGFHTDLYNCRFPAMIDDWRQKFAEAGQTSDQFPFGFVQLAPWRNNDSITTGFPDIRWHQTADYGCVPNDRMKNVFMAVAMDLPDFTAPFGSIHPRDKQDVAKRLLTEGLAVAYNRTEMIKLRGPFPTSFTIEIENVDTVIIDYDHHKANIEIRTTDGFEACCIQQSDLTDPRAYCDLVKDVWLPVPINTSDNTSVTVYYGTACSSKEKPYIGAIRYAWRESPCGFKKCAVYNKLSGYPAPPFVKYIYVVQLPMYEIVP